LTGEDIYCKEGFMDLFEKKAISICHPDVGWCGGPLEQRKIGTLATEHGIATAFHQSGSPASFFASVHCAASLENFMVMEHHNADDDWYNDLVDGVEKPFVQDGYVTVPDGPGLGFEFNEEANKKQLREPGWFEPTDEWNNEQSHDRLWS
jgi:L-alanine-DL-glutamate epimerase-like enolase superfamily enzyme